MDHGNHLCFESQIKKFKRSFQITEVAFHYPYNWIRFHEINKFYNVITKKWHFQQIKSWFQLTEKFEHDQNFQQIGIKNKWIGTRKTPTPKILIQMIPSDNPHPEKTHQRKFPPRITPTRTIPTRKIPTQDNSHPNNSHPENFYPG